MPSHRIVLSGFQSAVRLRLPSHNCSVARAKSRNLWNGVITSHNRSDPILVCFPPAFPPNAALSLSLRKACKAEIASLRWYLSLELLIALVLQLLPCRYHFLPEVVSSLVNPIVLSSLGIRLSPRTSCSWKMISCISTPSGIIIPASDVLLASYPSTSEATSLSDPKIQGRNCYIITIRTFDLRARRSADSCTRSGGIATRINSCINAVPPEFGRIIWRCAIVSELVICLPTYVISVSLSSSAVVMTNLHLCRKSGENLDVERSAA
jgi:hypothetical protein